VGKGVIPHKEHEGVAGELRVKGGEEEADVREGKHAELAQKSRCTSEGKMRALRGNREGYCSGKKRRRE